MPVLMARATSSLSVGHVIEPESLRDRIDDPRWPLGAAAALP